MYPDDKKMRIKKMEEKKEERQIPNDLEIAH